MATNIEIQILANTEAAQKAIQSFSQNATKELEKISFASTVTALSEGVEIATQFGEKLAESLGEAVSIALKASEATRLLNNAMRVSGEGSEFASERAEDFAKSLAKTTVYTDIQITSALGLAKTYGLVNSQSRDLVTAATNLAAFTGKDLEEAVRQLSETYAGNTRQLKRQFVELNQFTTEQLRAGAAVDYFANKLKGSAVDALDSLSGRLSQGKKDFEALQSFLGRGAILLFEDFTSHARSAASAIGDLFEAIKRDSTNAETKAAQAQEERKAAVKKFHDDLIEDENEYQAKLRAAADRKRELEAEEAKKELEKFKSEFSTKKKEIELASLDESARVTQKYANDKAIIERGFSLGLIKSKEEELKLIEGLEKESAQKHLDLLQKTRSQSEAAEKKFDDEIRKSIEGAANDPITRVVNIAFGNASIDNRSAIGLGAGFVNEILKGAQGAQAALQSVASSVATNLLGPAFGPIASQIVGALSQGPDKVREMVKAFVQAIPDLVKNIIEAIPALIDELVKDAPQFIKALVADIPEIVNAIIADLPQIIVELSALMPELGVTFITAVIENIPKMVSGFAQEFLKLPEQFLKAFLSLIPGGGALGGGKDGGGGGILGTITGGIGSVVSSVGDIFGFAEGGRTANLSSLAGDRGLVRIGPGEQTFSKDLTDKLDAYLNDSTSAQSQPTILQVVLNDKVVAESVYRSSKKGYRLAAT